MAEHRNTNTQWIGDRIYYIEPNDNYGHIDGRPVTPDYTDFCISFDLMAEISTRMKNTSINTFEGKSGNTDKYAILSWVTTDTSKDTQMTPVSFMQGVDAKNYNYLTTYYTDSYIDDIRKKNIVEGLGITSVDISFESYYTPTITINMVDVRGSSLFGKEESVHKNINGENRITADTVYGCFFTLPYPKFRLQVKGFYGQAVTYQLMCTDFRGNYNSQTGNFEIKVVFLGYDYGILADIPFQYLVAAPNASYAGRSYWDKNAASNPDWELSDGARPRRLTEFFQAIRNFNSSYGNDVSSADMAGNDLNEAYRKIPIIRTMKDAVDGMLSIADNGRSMVDASTYAKTHTYTARDGRRYILIIRPLRNDVDININDFKRGDKFADKVRKETDRYYNLYVKGNMRRIWKSMDDYKTQFPDDMLSTLDETDYPGSVESGWGESESEKYIVSPNNRYLDHIKKKGKGSVGGGVGSYEPVIILNSITPPQKINQTGSIAPGVTGAETTTASGSVTTYASYFDYVNLQVTADLSRLIKEIDGYFYIIAIDAGNSDETGGNFLDRLNAISRELGATVDNATETLESIENLLENQDEYITNKLGFRPTIGNVFKVIMCHLETLAHMIYICTDNIQNQITQGLRKPSLLGLRGLKDTDMSTYGLTNNPDSSVTSFPGIFIEQGSRHSSGNSNNIDEDDRSKTRSWVGDFKGRTTWEEKKLIDSLFDSIESSMEETSTPVFTGENGVGENYVILPSDYKNANYNAVIHNGPTSLAGFLGLRAAAIFGVMNKTADTSAATDAGMMEAWNYYLSTGKDKERVKSLLQNFPKGGATNAIINAMMCKGNFTTYDFSVYKSAGSKTQPIFSSKGDNYEYVYTSDSDGKDYVVPNPVSFKEIKNNYLMMEDINGKRSFFIPEKFEEMDGDILYNFKTTKKRYYNDGMCCIMAEDSGNSVASKASMNDGNGGYNKDMRAICLIREQSNQYYQSTTDNGYRYEPSALVLSDVTKSEEIKTVSGWTKYRGANVLFNDRSRTNNGRGNFLNNGTTVSVNNLIVEECTARMMSGNKLYKTALAWTPLYTKAPEATKALLFLSSFPYIKYVGGMDTGFTGSSTMGGLYSMPRAYVLAMGGYLKRAGDGGVSFFNSTHTAGGTVSSKINSVIPSSDKMFIFKYKKSSSKSGDVNRVAFGITDKKAEYINVPVIKDIAIRNAFINAFDDFLENEWPVIKKMIEDRKEYRTFDETDNIFPKAFRTDSALQPLLISLYLGTYAVMNSRGTQNNTKEKVNSAFVKKTILSAYVNGFVNGINEINKMEDKTTFNDSSDEITDEDEVERDFKIGIYQNLKSMWDKWFLSEIGRTTTNAYSEKETKSGRPWYTVGSFFPNFIFMDSFYKNTYDIIHLNCDKVLECYDGMKENATIMTFMGSLASKHHCLFLGLPDFVNIGDADKVTVENNMRDLFTPIPYSKKRSMDTFNKFILMYVHKPCENASDMNGYSYDGFDIWSDDGPSRVLPTTFNKACFTDGGESTPRELEVTRYGYHIPSFGVAANRQNNAIFKNIKVGMANPIATNESIVSMGNISRRGSGNDRKLFFYGQDLYPVYSGYSYTCELDMMGNAQIMPMMYFQLSNIPMFRGTYLIYGVSHSMKPGDMTTHVKAMKLSRYSMPFAQEWYTDGRWLIGADGGIYGSGCNTSYIGNVRGNGRTALTKAGGGIMPTLNPAKDTEAWTKTLMTTIKITIRTSQTTTKTVNLTVNKYYAEEIKQIFNEILEAKVNGKYFEIVNYGCYSHRQTRKPDGTSSNSLSMHSYGIAIDLNASDNPYGKKRYDADSERRIRTTNHPVYQIFASHGWGWGGLYGDYMHFSAYSENTNGGLLGH